MISLEKKAAKSMHQIFLCLRDGGMLEDDAARFVWQTLFCLYCDQTGIFFGKQFEFTVLQSKLTDDWMPRLHKLFSVLPPIVGSEQICPEQMPQRRLNDLRKLLLDACTVDWKSVSPAIFGNVYQYAITAAKRKGQVIRFTADITVNRLLKDLVFDTLHTKQTSHPKDVFLQDLSDITILDPACGCGNILIAGYAAIRRLEIETQKSCPNSKWKSLISIKNYCGIEYDTQAALLCRTALFIQKRVLDIEFAEELHQNLPTIDTYASFDNICVGNALRMEWSDLIPKERLRYIASNPPFISFKCCSHEQQEDMQKLFPAQKKLLDYCAGWLKKSAEFIENTDIRCGLVLTSSVCQGIQMPAIWQDLIKSGIHIDFAHRPFSWYRNNSLLDETLAQVKCVIVGISNNHASTARLYEYDIDSRFEKVRDVPHINPYLIDARDIFLSDDKTLQGRRTDLPAMRQGRALPKGADIYTQEKRNLLVESNPDTEKLFMRYLTAKDLMTDRVRFVSASYSFLNAKSYLVIPRHSSEKRRYIPIGYFQNEQIYFNDSVHIVADADLFLLGLLMSSMHMAWTAAVCGRLEMRYRYSNTLVYNNFPSPTHLSPKQHDEVARLAAQVLSVREALPMSLGDMYMNMPTQLQQAHLALDAAVEMLYAGRLFVSDSERIDFLFGMYNGTVSR